VILSETLQAIHGRSAAEGDAAGRARGHRLLPELRLLEGRAFQIAVAGHMPVSKELPYQWYDTPNVTTARCSTSRILCEKLGLPSSSASCCATAAGQLLPNLLASRDLPRERLNAGPRCPDWARHARRMKDCVSARCAAAARGAKTKFASEDWYDVWLPELSPSEATVKLGLRRRRRRSGRSRPAYAKEMSHRRDGSPARTSRRAVARDEYLGSAATAKTKRAATARPARLLRSAARS